VTVAPALKLVITKSSTDSENASRAAARIPGAISGSVTFVNVVHSLAPRSIAASSRWRSKPCRRAFTVTTTKEMLNITCAMKIVQKPVATPRLRNSVSSDAPSTTSAVVIGTKTSRFVELRPTKR
jgi:uncharacterized protein YpmS